MNIWILANRMHQANEDDRYKGLQFPRGSRSRIECARRIKARRQAWNESRLQDVQDMSGGAA